MLALGAMPKQQRQQLFYGPSLGFKVLFPLPSCLDSRSGGHLPLLSQRLRPDRRLPEHLRLPCGQTAIEVAGDRLRGRREQ